MDTFHIDFFLNLQIFWSVLNFIILKQNCTWMLLYIVFLLLLYCLEINGSFGSAKVTGSGFLFWKHFSLKTNVCSIHKTQL